MALLHRPADASRLLEPIGNIPPAEDSNRKRITRPSFAAYFEPYERGGGAIGQAYAALPEEARRTVREEVRRGLGDTGGPLQIECEIRLARGSA
jgi:hypothetical protein